MAARKTYHKENLRGDLLDAGRKFVKANGHFNLSIRTLAHEVGVSAGAPYHHFPDRRSFLLALATEGFREITDGALRVCSGTSSPAEKLHKIGVLFIRFADQNPHLVDLMYESELTTPALDPQLLDFQVLGHKAIRQQIIEACPGLPDHEADLRVFAFWSAVYGFASMHNKGVIHPSRETTATENIAEAIVERAVLSALAD